VVDKTVVATRIAAVRDAVGRIRATLPADRGVFLADRSIREIVILNLFVALQECVALAAHWLADAGLDVPSGYRGMFLALADRGLVDRGLAERLGSAAGLRNLVAHRYGVLDWARVHAIASTELDDLLAFCEARAEAAEDEGAGGA
jgi:uncharacterized protein YutE (UPF0331/DUF86 family)